MTGKKFKYLELISRAFGDVFKGEYYEENQKIESAIKVINIKKLKKTIPIIKFRIEYKILRDCSSIWSKERDKEGKIIYNN